jgi:CBS domain containing-hemolysin-like protein
MGAMEWVLLGVSVALMVICGVFGAAEYSFVAVDRAAVERAASTGDRRAIGVRKALRNLSTQLSGAQVGVTITNLIIGFLAEPAIAELLRGPLEVAGVPDGAVTGIAVAVALVLATVATMLVGELIPKKIGIAVPLRAAMATQGAMRFFTTVVKPAIHVLNG